MPETSGIIFLNCREKITLNYSCVPGTRERETERQREREKEGEKERRERKERMKRTGRERRDGRIKLGEYRKEREYRNTFLGEYNRSGCQRCQYFPSVMFEFSKINVVILYKIEVKLKTEKKNIYLSHI